MLLTGACVAHRHTFGAGAELSRCARLRGVSASCEAEELASPKAVARNQKTVSGYGFCANHGAAAFVSVHVPAARAIPWRLAKMTWRR